MAIKTEEKENVYRKRKKNKTKKTREKKTEFYGIKL